MKRQFYLTAAILTLTIFLAGILIGWYLDTKRIEYISKEYENLELDLRSLILENNFFQTFNNPDLYCESSFERLPKIMKEVDKLGNRLESFERINQFNLEEFERLKKNYILLNIDLWLRLVKLKQQCNYSIHTILYFYPEKECLDCSAQSLVLTYWKEKMPNSVMVFPIDGDLDFPLIKILKTKFNITTYPSLVIDEKYVVKGFISKEELGKYFS